ncbi:MAG TPA: nucleotidyltransferase family protein [Steroidobacteraceae bacterium]|jgi:predicted nucleotidyltransferase|nr:nucleotidyltransferase family protein [Steroidobacteraceae bacterium]
MHRAKILGSLTRNLDQIEKRYSVKALSLFGSAARDEMRKGSDIDVLVEFSGAATFDRYMDLKFYLEGLFGVSVDLVTVDAVKPRMRPLIERNLINVS